MRCHQGDARSRVRWEQHCKFWGDVLVPRRCRRGDGLGFRLQWSGGLRRRARTNNVRRPKKIPHLIPLGKPLLRRLRTGAREWLCPVARAAVHWSPLPRAQGPHKHSLVWGHALKWEVFGCWGVNWWSDVPRDGHRFLAGKAMGRISFHSGDTRAPAPCWWWAASTRVFISWTNPTQILCWL